MMFNYKVVSLIGIVIPIILFVFSILIIIKSANIVDFLTRKDDSSSLTVSKNKSLSTFEISVKIFGFFAFISSIPHISELLSRFLIMGKNVTLYNNTGKIELVSAAISALLYISAGFFLTLKSKYLTERILKIESMVADRRNNLTY